MRSIKNIILHCSDSLWGCAREIDQWHKSRGWSGIGYHYVVQNGIPTFSHMKNAHVIPALDGSIECGRYLDDDKFISDVERGAHAFGYNSQSIGICMIGVDRFTELQMDRTKRLILDLILNYRISIEDVMGHCETQSGREQKKTCPNIDMADFRMVLYSWKSARLMIGRMKEQ